MTAFSILDVAPIVAGQTPAQAMADCTRMAAVADRLGFTRYWLAEHHNMPGIASAATSVLVGHLAGRTIRIRVGAGGIMLPNHAPLMVAEQFGTLAALYPGRIDLGLGRAAGADPATTRALRRTPDREVSFKSDLIELANYFAPDPRAQVRAYPGEGEDVPLWVLGSSMAGAQVAAELGLPYAFAAHFAPHMLSQAINHYRAAFQPSAACKAPYVMISVNLAAAETDQAAALLHHSLIEAFARLGAGRPGPLPYPRADLDRFLHPSVRANVDAALSCSAVGSMATVRDWLARFCDAFTPDEVIMSCAVADADARETSLRLAAQAVGLDPV